MIKTIQYFILILFIGLLGSCSEEVNKTPDQLREEAREAIVLERTKLMNSQGLIDTNRANTMIDMYITFVQNNASDNDGPIF